MNIWKNFAKNDRKYEERTKFLLKSGPIIICRSLIEGQILKMVKEWGETTLLYQQFLKEEGFSGDDVSIEKLGEKLNRCRDEHDKSRVSRYIQYHLTSNKNEYVLAVFATLIPEENIVSSLGTLHSTKEIVRNEIRYLFSTLSQAVHKVGNIQEGNKVVLPLPAPPLDEGKCLAIATILNHWKYECEPSSPDNPLG